MSGYYLLAGLIFLVSWWVSNTLKKKFAHYSKLHLRNGLSGKEIAEQMLRDHGISDVQVISTAGQLTDHYNPTNKTVNLSESVYHQRNAAAAAVGVDTRKMAIAVSQDVSPLKNETLPPANFRSLDLGFFFWTF